ncbi:ornithine cyclodeaminase family protein [Umezawaea endophytica]|uniref:Ornithine cyclodeaminase family protein n=1 Tax=Umezawaea endophytica TaxID=1654476 RepID=A0A9X3A2R1_9PSEU|nr:ornithine cyclodeaminase family protein [Umezawaea endophytica]MCS7479368.1 ornithine cyclodeaminase family protein [Umezawaea endophytica]
MTPPLPQLGERDLLDLVPVHAAISALRDALLGDAWDAAGPPRSAVPLTHGELLVMPGEGGGVVGVKVVGVAPGNPALGLPRVTGTYLLHDAMTLRPVALLDGAALTLLRTSALSALAVDVLAPASTPRLLVHGTGPQAAAHVRAISAVRRIERVEVAGRTPEAAAAFCANHTFDVPVSPAGPDAVDHADLVVCCTSSSTPLFDGARLAPHAVVVAMGSHTLDARELDDTTVRRSSVVVEHVDTALREAGDVAAAVRAGTLSRSDLRTLADVVRGEPVTDVGPRLFRSVGMAWEDLAVAAEALRASTAAR